MPRARPETTTAPASARDRASLRAKERAQGAALLVPTTATAWPSSGRVPLR
jgi:hypothetical protein